MKRITIILLLCCICSCNSPKPKDILPSATMQKMLMDLHYAEVYCTMVNDSLHQMRNKNQDSLALYYKSIQAHYGLSDEAFIKTMDWYKHNPETLDSIYSQMITNGSIIEARLEKK